MASTSSGIGNRDDTNSAHRDFRDTLGQFATGVAVITARDPDQQPLGITVNSFSSVSLDPPLILWSLERTSFVLEGFLACRHFAVSVLSASQKGIALKFAQPEGDKFRGVETQDGLHDLPLLAGAVAHFECVKEQTFPGGDHVILLGRVQHFSKADGDPLIFHQGRLMPFTSGI